MPRDSEALPAGIYLVATPIGNLEDISFRQKRILESCDLVACEDTRRTGLLLSRLSIKKPLLSYHEHNEKERAEQISERAKAGERIAVGQRHVQPAELALGGHRQPATGGHASTSSFRNASVAFFLP